MDDDHHDGVFFAEEDQDCDENRTALIQNGISPISDHQQPTFPGISMEEMLVHEAAACYSDYMLSSEHLSTFGIINNPSSHPFQQTNPAIGSITCSNEIKHARADSLETKRKLEIHEEEEQHETSWDCKGQKRNRSSEVHNLNERLRRQKLQEKMKALRELIPNCDKREKGHVLDEAMKYIKTLQSQVQMMSMGAGVSMFHSPFMMPQHGMQIPTFPQFPPTNEYGIGIGAMGMGMGIPSLPSTMNAPMSHSGLPSPLSFASGVSGLCAPSSSSSAAHSIKYYSGNYVLPPWNGISFPNSVSQCTTSTEQGAPINGNDFCPIPVIGEGCSTGRGSSARVLPSQIIPPRVVREIKDYGCSISGSSEWDTSSSVAKFEDCS